ncbi:hypothetical protein ACI3LX_002017 [Candidozyma auris]
MLPRTSMLQLYARRVPAVAQWGVGLGFIIGWPHLVIGISNRNNKVPPINQVLMALTKYFDEYKFTQFGIMNMQINTCI